MKNETVTELAGFVEGLSLRGVQLPTGFATEFPELMDVCGTGGDGAGTFNVSTGVALVLASCGVPVAKHGNKGVSSASGSSDVLEALGLKSNETPEEALRSLRNFGVSFLYAPAFHPVLGKLSKIRKNLGVYTFLNALGPLLNPAPLKRQMMGVYHADLLMKVAQVLKEKGIQEALVVHGSDGLDEVTLSGPTSVARLLNGEVKLDTVSPEDFGLKRAALTEVRGGSASENAKILISIFEGKRSAKRDLILINSAMALLLAKKAKTPAEAIEMAAFALDSGKTLLLLERMQKQRGETA